MERAPTAAAARQNESWLRIALHQHGGAWQGTEWCTIGVLMMPVVALSYGERYAKNGEPVFAPGICCCCLSFLVSIRDPLPFPSSSASSAHLTPCPIALPHCPTERLGDKTRGKRIGGETTVV